MPPSEHSSLGASGYYRWKACPGSVALSKGLPRHTSSYAAEGSVAHALAEDCIRHRTNPEQHIGEKRIHEGTEVEITDDMASAVRIYVDHIRGYLTDKMNEVALEVAVDMSEVYPGLRGTADCVIWNSKTKILRVSDYKHGAGIVVDVEDNEQLQFYAAAALVSSKRKELPEKVIVEIIQPRAGRDNNDPIRSWEFDVFDLVPFIDTIKAAAYATEQKDAPVVSGKHCKFCPAAALCPVRAKEALASAQEVFSCVDGYDPEILARLYERVKGIRDWCDSVEKFALDEAKQGRVPPRFKLVPTKKMRRFEDEVIVESFLRNMGLLDADMYDRKFKTVAQMEKSLGKDRKDVLSPFVVSESSGLKLVSDRDEGEALDMSAEAVFGNE